MAIRHHPHVRSPVPDCPALSIALGLSGYDVDLQTRWSRARNAHDKELPTQTETQPHPPCRLMLAAGESPAHHPSASQSQPRRWPHPRRRLVPSLASEPRSVRCGAKNRDPPGSGAPHGPRTLHARRRPAGRDRGTNPGVGVASGGRTQVRADCRGCGDLRDGLLRRPQPLSRQGLANAECGRWMPGDATRHAPALRTVEVGRGLRRASRPGIGDGCHGRRDGTEVSTRTPRSRPRSHRTHLDPTPRSRSPRPHWQANKRWSAEALRPTPQSAGHPTGLTSLTGAM